MAQFGLALGDPLYLRVFKEEQEMELWVKTDKNEEFVLFKIYRICKWSGKLGPKKAEGDMQAPEGFYFVTADRMIPETRYHMGIDLGYPNLYDRSHQRGGSNVRIHGKCLANSSYALGDDSIEEVFTIASAAIEQGQEFFRVHCFPFRMDDKVMDRKISQYPAHESFWENVKEGYDFFEIMGCPPNVTVSADGRYFFSIE